jgi:hypothetical protein
MEAVMVDVYELAAQLFARDFAGVGEGKCREEAQWAIRAAGIFAEECRADYEARTKKPPAIVRRGLG